MNFTECPACGSKTFKNIGKPVNADINSIYSVVECEGCRLNWCNPMPSTSDLNEYYAKYYETRYSTVDKFPIKTRIKAIVTLRQLRLKSFFTYRKILS